MNLREPVMRDVPFAYECFLTWPKDDEYHAEEDVKRYMVRWTNKRDGEECYIAEEDSPIGLISYRLYDLSPEEIEAYKAGEDLKGLNFAADGRGELCIVDNLIVHPDYRGMGHSTEIIRAFRPLVEARGALFGVFKTLDTVVRWQLGDKYVDLGNHQGRLDKGVWR